MRKVAKKEKEKKEKIPMCTNPFEDLCFWLNLATLDFGFFENEEKQMRRNDDSHRNSVAYPKVEGTLPVV